MASLSVVLSFWNEIGTLPEFLRRTRDVLGHAMHSGLIDDYELIFVDDASTDGSDALLQSEAQRGDLVLVRMAQNSGVAECVLAGFAIAGGDAVVYMDCDLQDPPEVIPELVAKWKAAGGGVDIIHTHRISRLGEGRTKRLLTALGYRFLAKSSNNALEAEVGDFKLLSRRAVDIVLMHQEQLPFLRGLVSHTRLASETVDYVRESRFDGAFNTHFPVLAPRTLKGHLNRTLIAFTDYPLKLLLGIGVVLGVLSSLYLVVVLVQKVMGWYEPGWPALMAGIVFFGSLNLMAMGILGLYVNVIFLEVKRRSLYTVQSVHTRRAVRLPSSLDWPSRVTPLQSHDPRDLV